ncbi:hypothetical protein [Burkholderia ubonensis]|uniref:Uncharacterized protein n=1 Tax=Burkholderia ubonensis TaxID=101571 RepID=A0AA40UXK9_9BURK|nr:hypothetical protein [Burkholderia ubonensis]KVZ30835.1 hypothetical protein WL16_13340 [Burkholderia ubonensis]KWC00264.1 hypothetical protein WL43_25720 [Burkholderia ubonensis]KWZ58680.1 hypothetical protein WK57_16310 [Burkholderia ubonensis]
MPQGADDLPLNANGPAYTSQQDRHGVPLSYVGEKLSRAIEDLHRHAQRCQGGRDDLRGAMYRLLVAYLGLHNMLGKANDRTLTDRLLDGSSQNLETWLRLVDREGDVRGLAGLDNRD